MADAIAIEDIRTAAGRLAGHARRTPLLESDALNDRLGRRILIKAECLQRSGSFKFRGAWNTLAALPPQTRAQGVAAYSSGNHAQGVALAARLCGAPAVIVMPKDAPAAKIDGARGYGAEIALYDRWGESREEIGARLAADRGLTLIRPYDEPTVMAGQGTCGLEIAEQAAAAGVAQADVLVCAGGGGLLSGAALALNAQAPGLRPRPVEPEGFDDMARSLKSGAREAAQPGARSICDAVLAPSPGELTFPIIRRLSGPGLVVSDDEARRAMAAAWHHFKIVAEPGGAVALAAALFRANEIDGDAAIAIVSGGNVDPAFFAETIVAYGGAA